MRMSWSERTPLPEKETKNRKNRAANGVNRTNAISLNATSVSTSCFQHDWKSCTRPCSNAGTLPPLAMSFLHPRKKEWLQQAHQERVAGLLRATTPYWFVEIKHAPSAPEGLNPDVGLYQA